MKATAYTKENILKALDESVYSVFPPLENLYIAFADVRLSVYRDEMRWAIVMEFLGRTDHQWCDHGGIHLWIYRWGNCLTGYVGQSDKSPICMTEDGLEGPTFGGKDYFDEENYLVVREDAETIRIRGQIVPIERDLEKYAARGIVLDHPPMIRAEDLLRSLLPEYHELLMATEAELRVRLPQDLPLILRLDEWHHPDTFYPSNEVPSGSEAFQMIADVLVSGDPALYQPTEAPNTHWSNWPDYGGV